METLKKIFFLLNSSEKVKFFFLSILILSMAFFDVLGVASIVPFMSLLTNPNLIETNEILIRLFDIFSSYGVDNKNKFIFFFGILFLILMVISIFVRGLTNYALVYFSLMREYSIGKKLLEMYLYQNYSWFLNRNSSEISKIILSEVTQVIDFTLVPLLRVIAQSVVAFALIILLFFYDTKLTLVVGLTLAFIYGFIFYLIKNYLSRVGKQRLIANKGRFQSVLEAFGAIKEIKLGALEKFYVNNFSGHAKTFSKNQAIARVAGLLPRYFVEIVVFGGTTMFLLILIQSGVSFLDIIPTLSLYVFAGYRLLPVIQQIYDSITRLQFSSKALDAIYNDLKDYPILDNKKSRSDDGLILPFNNLIKLIDISYRYPETDKFALKNINLSIKAFSKVGIVGSTGSGKTTLIDIILGLLNFYDGKIIIDGLNLNTKNKRSWQKIIGYVPQQIYLADTTIARNIAFGTNENDIDLNKIREVSEIANLHDFVIKKLPNGYNTIIGERGIRLSGGERQRIGIARAIYNDPKLIIFDEATSALDNFTEKVVLDAIDKLKNKITIIVVAHRLATVKNCDLIFFLEEGKIISKGSYEELIRSSKKFKKMIELN